MSIGTPTEVSHAAGSGDEPGAPLRIVWLEDGPHVVEEAVQAEYAVIVKAGRRATPDEVREWRVRK